MPFLQSFNSMSQSSKNGVHDWANDFYRKFQKNPEGVNRAFANLFEEKNLEPCHFSQLLDGLAVSSEPDPETRYNNVCSRIENKGPRAKIPDNVQHFARIVPLKYILSQIIEDSEVEILQSDLPAHKYPLRDKLNKVTESIMEIESIKVGNPNAHNVFTTFAEALIPYGANPVPSDPYESLPVMRAYQISGTQSNIAQHETGDAAVVYEYGPDAVPEDPGVHVPTIADAGYYPEFKPSPKDPPFGLSIDLKYPDRFVAGLPEVVHPNISASATSVHYLLL